MHLMYILSTEYIFTIQTRSFQTDNKHIKQPINNNCSKINAIYLSLIKMFRDNKNHSELCNGRCLI